VIGNRSLFKRYNQLEGHQKWVRKKSTNHTCPRTAYNIAEVKTMMINLLHQLHNKEVVSAAIRPQVHSVMHSSLENNHFSPNCAFWTIMLAGLSKSWQMCST
jgi:SH3-like domain-containing protein